MKGTEESGCQGEQRGWEDKTPGVQPIRSRGVSFLPQSLASPISQRSHTKEKEQLMTWPFQGEKISFPCLSFSSLSSS